LANNNVNNKVDLKVSSIVQKHDIEVNWNKATTFIPNKGQIIVYDIEVDENNNTLALPEGRTNPYTYERFKIGDGIHDVTNLPFVSNVERGEGKGTIQQVADKVSDGFDFTGKNPHATELDGTLTGSITYGATGDYATAFGGKSSAQGKRSMAVGTTTIAKGNYSFAAGDNSVALGNDSAVFGYQNTAAGQASLAAGSGTQSKGNASTSLGRDTVAEGDYSLAAGFESKAKHFGSTALGKGLETAADDQVVIGRYNDTGFTYHDTHGTPIFTVGCGRSDEWGSYRRNAFTIASDGTMFVGDYPYTDKSNHIGSLYENKEYVWPEAEVRDENNGWVRHLGTHVPIQSVTDNDVNYSSLTVAKSWAGADTIVQRNDKGQIIVTDPTEDTHAATKAYVDNEIANIDIPKIDLSNYATVEYVNSKVSGLDSDFFNSLY